MPRTVSASRAKNRFGSLVDWAVENRDEVIVQRRGEPRAVIMSFEEYQRIAELKDRARRQEALGRLEELRETVQARNKDLSEEQAEALADQFSREVVEEMIQEGKIQYTDQ